MLRLAFKFRKLINILFFLNKRRIGRGNRLFAKDALLIKSKIICKGKNNRIELLEGVVLYKTTVFIVGDNNNVRIGKNSVIKYANINVEDSKNNILIGEKTHMCGRINIAALEGTDIEIGNECLFSAEVEIRTSDSHSIFNESGIRINTAKNVKIGNHVWCGQRVFILKGAEVKDDSVIGAGSIVNKVYEQGKCILAGAPAKIVKTSVLWDKNRISKLT